MKYVETMNTAKGARVDVESVQHIFYRTRQSPLAYLVLRDTIGLWGLWHVFLVGLASTARVGWKVAGLAHRDQLPMKEGRPAFHALAAMWGRASSLHAATAPKRPVNRVKTTSTAKEARMNVESARLILYRTRRSLLAYLVHPAPTGRQGWPNASRVPQDISVVKETAQNA